MNFLIDAHLPRRIVYRLREAGYDVLHTLDLPQGNRTPDQEINVLSLQQARVVITKDEDFVNTFLVHRQPYKLLLVSTGNIKNSDLEHLFLRNIEQIAEAFSRYDFIEMDWTTLTFHE